MSGLITAEPDALPLPPDSGPGLFGDAPATAPATAPTATVKAAPYRVLARKYRPTGFADLIGQDVMVRTLRNAFTLNRIAHAFMLTGVRGVGKTTTARIIARALNCVGPDGTGGPTADPCGVCGNCVAILADRHPDVVEMDAATRNKVDDAREIIEAVRYKPMQARTKVFILDEVHMLTTQAFNALLKTLEEPPPHITFIFATTEIRKVPITVLSRCQRFDLRRISAAELSGLFSRVAAAESVSVAPAALELIARAADGSARDGLSLLDQAIARMDGAEVTGAEVADMLGLADRAMVFDLLDVLMAGDIAAALAITDRAHEFGADLGMVLGDLLDLVHTLTRLRSVPELRDGLALPEMERTRGAALADKLSIPVLGRAWQMLLKGIAEVDQAPDRRAAAEMVLIRLCHVADMPPPGELVRRLTAAARAAGPGIAAPAGASSSAGAEAASSPARRFGRAADPGITGSEVSAGPASTSDAVGGKPDAPVSPDTAVNPDIPANPGTPASAHAAPNPNATVSLAMSAGPSTSPVTTARHTIRPSPEASTSPTPSLGTSSRPGASASAVPVRTQEMSPNRSPDGHMRSANGAAIALAPMEAPPDPAPPSAPRVASYRDVVALVAEMREPTLHGYLRNAVHLVRFASGIIELRPEPDAPRDLAANLGRVLQEATGQRWTIALSKAEGEKTLDQQAQVLDLARRGAAADHPLVQAIMAAFPGAVLGAVADHTADAYGLPPEDFPEMTLGEPVEPADFMTDMPDDWEDDR